MELSKMIINDSFTVREALKRLDTSAKKILLVANDGKLKAVITDGDIRRWVLKNGDLTATVKEVMNLNPIYLTEETKHQAKEIMKRYLIEAVPIVDKKGVIKSVVFWNENEEEMKSVEKLNTPVIIMAGGLGTRLYPYTKILPKPLIPIGETPIIERIMNKFMEFGANNFYVTVNYKKNMIKSYFSDLNPEYTVNFIEEDKPLGTGGSLSLLKNIVNETFFVTNCDILIDADYSKILKYHKESGNKLTVVCSIKNFLVPYGVIKLKDDGVIESVEEKPEYSFLTNTGMYIIEAEVLQDIPENSFFNLPDIITQYVNAGIKVGVYPISERAWMDMGQIDEMQEMMRRLNDK